MRKRSLAASIGVAALLVLAVAPGASAQLEVTITGSLPLDDGVWSPPGGPDGDVEILADGGDPQPDLVPPIGSPFGNVTILPNGGPPAAGVFVPPGGPFGDVAILPNGGPPGPGVLVPSGGQFGDVTVEDPLAPLASSVSSGASADTAGINGQDDFEDDWLIGAMRQGRLGGGILEQAVFAPIVL